jgi:hypothetical protein
LGHQPYVHAVGFNVEETGRIARDTSVTMGGRRHPIYPLAATGWSRACCQRYLFGVWWPKSCCHQCCFVSVSNWPDQLARYQASPGEAYKRLVDEFVTVALNHRSGLFGPGKSLCDRLRADGAHEVHALADTALDTCGWAVYRVRRRYTAAVRAWRSIEIVHRGERAGTGAFVAELAEYLRLPLRTDGEHTRLWLTAATEGYPRLEKFYVAAPDSVADKARGKFEIRWRGHADPTLLALERTAETFIPSASLRAA